MAKLYFRYGAMNSGKTTNLLQVSFNYKERGMNSIIIKPSVDTKANGYIVSRLGIKEKVDYLIKEKEDIYSLIKKHTSNISIINCILVDEVQFMSKEQIDDLFKIAVELNIPVIGYGLRTDFLMNGFEGATRMLLLAHSIEELKTICKCGKKAMLNARKINDNFVFKGNQVVIDNGKNNISYEALCPECYLKYMKGDSK